MAQPHDGMVKGLKQKPGATDEFARKVTASSVSTQHDPETKKQLVKQSFDQIRDILIHLEQQLCD